MPESITFSNDNFRDCVNHALQGYRRNFKDDHHPTIQEVNRLTYLLLEDVDSLEDLMFFNHLTDLHIKTGFSLDLSPLLKLKSLTSLLLDCEVLNDDISVINPVISMLIELEIDGTHNWPLDKMSGSHSIRFLTLYHVWIDDLSVIKRFDKISNLEIDYERMPLDISVLSEYNFTLERLVLICEVDDFEPLANNLNLIDLYTSNFGLSRLAEKIDFHKITELLKRRYDAPITLAEYKQLHWFNLFVKAENRLHDEDTESYFCRIIEEMQQQENLQAHKMRLDSLGFVNDAPEDDD